MGDIVLFEDLKQSRYWTERSMFPIFTNGQEWRTMLSGSCSFFFDECWCYRHGNLLRRITFFERPSAALLIVYTLHH